MYQIKRPLLTVLAVSVLLSRWYGPTIAQNQDARVLELGKTVERELAGEQAHSYLIELAANDFLHVIVEQRGVDVVVRVYAPAGKKLKEVDSPNGTEGPEPVLLIAETTGVYRLEVRSLEKGAAGRYAVTITEKRTATSEDLAQLDKQALLEQAQDLSSQADLLRGQGRYKDALPLAQRVLAIREKGLGPEHPTVATALNELAVLYHYAGDYVSAEPLYQRVLAIREKILGPDHPLVALSLGNLAELYRVSGDYARAAPLYIRSLAIDEKVLGLEHSDVAIDLNNLALLYQAQGDYARALPLLQRALAIREKALGSEHPLVAQSLNNLAALHEARGDYARALPLYQRAQAIRERVLGPEHLDVANSLNNLALLYRAQGDYARALPLLQGALAIRENALGSEHPLVANSLSNLATVYQATGDYAHAMPLYQAGLTIWEKALGSGHPLVATALSNLASLYQVTGDYARAEALFQRAIAIDEKALGPGHSDVATVINNLALLYQAQDDYARAAPLLQRALAIREKALGSEHPLVATALNNLALLYQAQSDYARAAPLLQRALAMREKALGSEHPLVATALSNLALLYRATGDYAQAVSLYQRANEVQETNIAVLLSAGSQQQKQSYLDTLSGNANVAVSLHVQDAPQNAGATRLALNTVLRRKGRALDAFAGQLDSLRRRSKPEDKKLLDDLAAVQSQLANLQLGGGRLAPEARQAEVARLNVEQERLEDAISRRSAEFRAVRQPVTLELVQAAVPTDAALVELFVYKPFNTKAKTVAERFDAARYVAYVVRRSESVPQFVDLGEAAPIDAATAQFRNALKSPNTPKKQVKQLARDLDARLMQPIRKLLGNTHRVFLSPDGGLNLIPFEALMDENGYYLVENYSFNYLTSGRDLLRLQVTGNSETGASIIANPQFDLTQPVVKCRTEQRGPVLSADLPDSKVEYRGTDFTKFCYSTLAGTTQEAAGLVPLLRGAKLWAQKDATEAALKSLHRPRVLHIATHAFFFPDQPTPQPEVRGLRPPAYNAPTRAPQGENALLRSGLILAGVNQRTSGSNEDGVLTAMEAAGLDLFGTKLVVLSACETGLGDVQNGQGVYGLRRALVLAGSETQIISLWKVSDDATRALMVAYYKRLQAGEGRVAAMRAVQLEMLRGELRGRATGEKRGTTDTGENRVTKDYRHPYYWAAFIQSGDWRSIETK